MTVGTKVKQTVASLEGCIANLKTFALETQNQTAKQQYSTWAQQLEPILEGLNQRVQQIEEEEPQYRES